MMDRAPNAESIAKLRTRRTSTDQHDMPARFYSAPLPKPANYKTCWQCDSKDLEIKITRKGVRCECADCGCVRLFGYPLGPIRG